MADCRGGNVGIGEVSGKEDEGDIADVFRVDEARNVANFERGLPSGVEDLRGTLDGWESAGINEFLGEERVQSLNRLGRWTKGGRNTWRKTLPKILSVSSLNMVENMTVTRSGDAWM